MKIAAGAACLCVVFLGLGAVVAGVAGEGRPGIAGDQGTSAGISIADFATRTRGVPLQQEGVVETSSVASVARPDGGVPLMTAALPQHAEWTRKVLGNAAIVATRSQDGSVGAGQQRDEAGGPRGEEDSPPQPCPEDALFGQRCVVLEDGWAVGSPSSANSGYTTYDKFWGLQGDISGLTWYGVIMDSSTQAECIIEPATFEITFFEDGGGVPGTETCSYIVSAYGVPTNADFFGSGAYARGYTVDLPTPCTLADGWVSIVFVGDSADCWFYWIASPEGDGSHCYDMRGEMVCSEPGTGDDMSLCLLGSVYPGACCDDLAGNCVDEAAVEDCLPPSRFTPGVFCDDLNPPCGQITGACCEGTVCLIRTPAECLSVGGVYKGDDVPCDPSPCMGACCSGNQVCEIRLEAECLGLSAFYAGDGTTCDPNPCPPSNDDCANAEPLVVDTLPFDTTYATSDGPQVCGLEKNAWFCYTAPATGTVTIVTSQLDYETWWGPSCAAYEGCTCEPFPAALVCDPWGEGVISFDVQEGVQYLIEVGTGGGGTEGGLGLLDLGLDAWAYGACCTEDPPYCSETFENECTGTFAGNGTTCDPTDCNGSGVPDACDIAMGTSEDCNGNGIPDECDIADATSYDYDVNGVPDECDPDCNGNGIVDACDADCSTGNCGALTGCGQSQDCQPDGIPDECQIGGTSPEAILWNNGEPALESPMYYSFESQTGGTYTDALAVDDFFLSNDARINTFHAYFEDSPDFNWTGRVRIEVYPDNGFAGPDESAGPVAVVWVPSDGGNVARSYMGDGPYGLIERYDVTGLDIELAAGTWWIGMASEGNGATGTAFWAASRAGGVVVMGETHFRCVDWDMPELIPLSWLYGTPYDVAFSLGTTAAAGSDCDGNSNPDDCDIRDCDGSLWCLDCNSNGVPDGCEPDCNGNGIADECDIRDCDGSPACSDCNANGVPDACDLLDAASFDYDLNGVPDECDPDCNENGVPDACDLDCQTGNCANHPLGCGGSQDCQQDGIPDDCQLTDEYEYLLDDGVHDGTIGISEDGFMLWMTQFYVSEGFERVGAVNLSWGYVMIPGMQATVYLWSDPNGDGDPADAQVLASADTIVAEPGTDTFVSVAIPSTYVGSAGTSFFVGVVMYQFSFDYPAALDSSVSQGRCWMGGDSVSIDPNNLAAAEVPPFPLYWLYQGSWLLRAVGIVNLDCNGNGVPDECELCGDLDGNGSVDYGDYVMFRSAFGGVVDGNPAYDQCCDYDNSGAVGLADYNAWLECYRAFIGDPLAGPPSAPGTPQPTLGGQGGVKQKQKLSRGATLNTLH